MAEKSAPWNPDDACCLSHLTLGWITPLAMKGYRKPLAEEDLYGLPKKFHTDGFHERCEARWTKEVDAAKAAARKPSLMRSVLRMAGSFDVFRGCLLLAVHALMNSVARPLLLRQAMGVFTEDSPIVVAMMVAAGLAACTYCDTYCRVCALRLRLPSYTPRPAPFAVRRKKVGAWTVQVMTLWLYRCLSKRAAAPAERARLIVSARSDSLCGRRKARGMRATWQCSSVRRG